jgi:O-antigen/teichoic acid export membrane protein
MSNSNRQNLGSVAIRGSVLNSAQWVFNKGLTAGAMLLIAWFLSPDEYGTGTQALAISAFAFVLPVMTLGDVLIAHPRHVHTLAASAQTLAYRLAVVTAVLTVLLIPVALHFYPSYSATWLGGLLIALSVKPLIEARLMLPLTLLRVQMEYPRIALVEGVIQAAATLSSIFLAAIGGKAAALVAPQIVATAARSQWYRRIAPTERSGPTYRSRIRLLLHHYWRAASAQYLHNILVGLEILVLGVASGDVETGLFGLAFTVAVQANGVIAYQLGQILQPILGHLQTDSVRQVNGFLKAERVLSAVCVPICLCQALIAEPLFRVAFPQKWQPAIPVFQVVSLAQAFYFATGPAMACLRAQRRFNTFLVWQAVQFAVSMPLYWVGARQAGAVGVASFSAAVWCTSSLLVVWLCTLPAGRGYFVTCLGVFVRPWLVGLPVFGLAYPIVQRSLAYGRVGELASILLLGPLATLLSIWLARYLHRDIRGTLDGLGRSILVRLGR